MEGRNIGKMYRMSIIIWILNNWVIAIDRSNKKVLSVILSKKPPSIVHWFNRRATKPSIQSNSTNKQ